MTTSNRALNRILLILLGLIALAGAALLLRPEIDQLLEPAGLVTPTLGLTEAPAPWLQGGIIALAALAVIIALAWTTTRGRGADGTAIERDGISIDANLVEGMLRRQLDDATEIAHVRLRAFRPKDRVLLAEIQVTRGADLADIHHRVQDAVATTDQQLGTPLPLVAHITTGLRSRLAHERRTH
ncbi:hypothetical protein [Arenivirga flava]|uniref:Alkaline shock response membrane anchor protein AmaP n=1 Tax=Arenivirga flava TaxID=1930060 RepID=A0AA37XA76_9MICO|nr:hypothetical protein [Arenivirga flava]GMA29534.1 hypothetical protein GCM10025874_27870 [Arenivirga flava]